MSDFTSFVDPTKVYADWVYEHGLQHPYGECQCGCGQVAPVSKVTSKREGYLSGHPKRFVHSHWANVQPIRSIAERFWQNVDRRDPNECWLWKAGTRNGYGRLLYNGKIDSAHRISYELHYGPIPNGMKVCHNCPSGDNPSCVNPSHLFLGTQAENVHDLYAKGHAPNRKGEIHPRHKLRNDEVVQIRKKHSNGATYQALSLEYGVSATNIAAIIKRKVWKHLP